MPQSAVRWLKLNIKPSSECIEKPAAQIGADTQQEKVLTGQQV